MQVKARLAVQQHLSLQWLHRSPVYLQIYFHKKSFFFKLLYIFRVRVKAVAAAPSLESGSPPILLPPPSLPPSSARLLQWLTARPPDTNWLTPLFPQTPVVEKHSPEKTHRETQGRKKRWEKRKRKKRLSGDMWQVGVPTAQVFNFFYSHFWGSFQPQYFSNERELKSVAVILLLIAQILSFCVRSKLLLARSEPNLAEKDRFDCCKRDVWFQETDWQEKPLGARQGWATIWKRPFL